MKWECKGRLSDLRIKKELPRVKTRCSQKVKISKKTFFGNKIRNSGEGFKDVTQNLIYQPNPGNSTETAQPPSGLRKVFWSV